VISSPAGNLRLLLSTSGDIYTYAEPRAYVEDSDYDSYGKDDSDANFDPFEDFHPFYGSDSD